MPLVQWYNCCAGSKNTSSTIFLFLVHVLSVGVAFSIVHCLNITTRVTAWHI